MIKIIWPWAPWAKLVWTSLFFSVFDPCFLFAFRLWARIVWQSLLFLLLLVFPMCFFVVCSPHLWNWLGWMVGYPAAGSARQPASRWQMHVFSAPRRTAHSVHVHSPSPSNLELPRQTQGCAAQRCAALRCTALRCAFIWCIGSDSPEPWAWAEWWASQQGGDLRGPVGEA